MGGVKLCDLVDRLVAHKGSIVIDICVCPKKITQEGRFLT